MFNFISIKKRKISNLIITKWKGFDYKVKKEATVFKPPYLKQLNNCKFITINFY